MRYTATVSVAAPGRFDTIAEYRGELGYVRFKAARKLRQLRAREAMNADALTPTEFYNWGEAFFAVSAPGRGRPGCAHYGYAIRYDCRERLT